jgi:hypothetical protein
MDLSKVILNHSPMSYAVTPKPYPTGVFDISLTAIRALLLSMEERSGEHAHLDSTNSP